MNPPVPRTDTPQCDRCDAVCCRLTVVLMPEDRVPSHYVTRNAQGVEVMDRDEDGWCVAVDHTQMSCSIYEQRPTICRKFKMGGPQCREVRAEYADHMARGIPLKLYDS